MATAATVVAFAGSAPAADTTAAAVDPCEVNNVRLTFFPAAESGAGTLADNFRLTIRRGSGQPSRCTVRGYPHVQLLGKRGRVLPVKVRRAGGKKRRLTLAKGRPVHFRILRRNPENANCKTRRVYRISVHLPGQAKALVVRGFDPIRFCVAGTRVTPLRRNL